MSADPTEELTLTFGRLSLTVRSSTASSSNGLPAQGPSGPPPSSAAASAAAEDPEAWPTRDRRAREQGASARRVLDGAAPSAPTLPRTRKRPTVYVVLRNHEGFVYEPALVLTAWGETKALVQRGTELGLSVFAGFASRREAEHYTTAAGCTWA